METTLEKPAEKTGLQKAQATIRDMMTKMSGEMEKVLPKHLTAERMMRVALTSINKSPKLLACTPHSLIECVMTCAQLGIEPDGRRAHLIPYKDKCTLIIDYKGLVELAMNSGDVANIHADVICFNDDFEFDRGQIKKHVIDFKRARGDLYAAYVIITKKDGSEKCEVMTRDEIEGIRKRSRSGNEGPWVTDYNEMAKKTVFRRASKWIKLSPEVRDKIDEDELFETPATPVKRPIIDMTTPEPEEAETKPKTFLGKGKAPTTATEAAEKEVTETETGNANPAPEPEPPAPEVEIPQLSPDEVLAMMVEICADFDMDPHVVENWLAAKGQLKKGETLKDLSSEKLAEIKKNPANFINDVRGVRAKK